MGVKPAILDFPTIDGNSSPQIQTLSRDRRGLTLTLLAAVFAVHFLDRQILAILVSPIKAELGLSDTAIGVLSGFAFTVDTALLAATLEATT